MTAVRTVKEALRLLVGTRILETEEGEAVVTGNDHWVLVDFSEREKYAIWRNTGEVYRVGPDGAVEDDPLELA